MWSIVSIRIPKTCTRIGKDALVRLKKDFKRVNSDSMSFVRLLRILSQYTGLGSIRKPFTWCDHIARSGALSIVHNMRPVWG